MASIYAECVPQVIRDMMGEDINEWSYILDYNTIHWYSPRLKAAPSLRSTKTDYIDLSEYDGDTNLLFSKLQEIYTDKKYISSRFEFGDSNYLYVEYSYQPTPVEKLDYEIKLQAYYKCVRKYAELQKVIKDIFEVFHEKGKSKPPETIQSLTKELETIKGKIKKLLDQQ